MIGVAVSVVAQAAGDLRFCWRGLLVAGLVYKVLALVVLV